MEGIQLLELRHYQFGVLESVSFVYLSLSHICQQLEASKY